MGGVLAQPKILWLGTGVCVVYGGSGGEEGVLVGQYGVFLV